MCHYMAAKGKEQAVNKHLFFPMESRFAKFFEKAN